MSTIDPITRSQRRQQKKLRRNANKNKGNNQGTSIMQTNVKMNLSQIEPLTPTQHGVFDCYDTSSKMVALLGYPGTGKSFISVFLAMRSIIEKQHRKLIIIRSTVQGRDMGFLKGSDKEKIAAFEDPYRIIFNDLYGRGDAYEIHKKLGVVEFMSTAFLRSCTFDDSVIMVDEAQNMSSQELDTITTRVGKNTRLILIGDTGQDDLTSERYNEYSGLREYTRLIKTMTSHYKVFNFNENDIVRSEFVKAFIIAKYGKSEKGPDIDTSYFS